MSITQGLENIELNYTEPTRSHTPSTSNFIPNDVEAKDPTGNFAQDEAKPEDPFANTFAYDSEAASEPDEVDYPIPSEDGPHEVDINIVAENFAQGTSTSSGPAMLHQTTQQTFYRSILFFEQTFRRYQWISIDVPNVKYAKFYDKNKGKLDVKMLFKNKEALIEAVKDHSIRYVRASIG
ncbi:UNVERIFIED_CONTAM: hypothetical protein Sindi_0847700 [Sesamum indicum]